MGNKKAVLGINNLHKLDVRLYYFIAISIFVITFIIRIKTFTSYYNYNFSKSLGTVFNLFTYYKLISLIVLFLACIGIFIYRAIKYRIKFRFDAITIGILLIILSSTVSTLITDLSDVAIWGLYTRTNGLLAYISLFGLFLIISKLSINEKQLNFLARGVNIVSIIIVVIGIMEFFGYSIYQMEWYRNIYIPSELRSILNINFLTGTYVANSIFGQQNYFGAFSSVIFPFITIQALHAKTLMDKVLYSVGSVMLLIGGYIALSMGPWVTLIAMLGLIIITYKHWKSYIHLSILLALYVLALVFLAKYQPSMLNESFDMIRAGFALAGSKLLLIILPVILVFILYYKYKKVDKYKLISALIIISILITIVGYMYILLDVAPNHMDMVSYRGYVWHYTYQLLKQNFIIGYGPDTLYYNFPQENPDTAKYFNGVMLDKPHNMYLQVIFDNGLFGLIGFLIMLTATLLILLKATYKSEDSTAGIYAKAVFLTTLAYMIQGMVNDNHMSVQPILYLVIATGIAVSREQSLLPNKKI